MLAALCLLATGCAGLSQPLAMLPETNKKPAPEPEPTVLAAPYHEHALYNFRLGRTYMAEGRYELAKERYLLALSVSRNEELRERLAAELDGVEKLLKTQR
jgi:hypothetical protein